MNFVLESVIFIAIIWVPLKTEGEDLTFTGQYLM